MRQRGRAVVRRIRRRPPRGREGVTVPVGGGREAVTCERAVRRRAPRSVIEQAGAGEERRRRRRLTGDESARSNRKRREKACARDMARRDTRAPNNTDTRPRVRTATGGATTSARTHLQDRDAAINTFRIAATRLGLAEWGRSVLCDAWRTAGRWRRRARG